MREGNNKRSITFRCSLGLLRLRDPKEDGVPVARDYSAPHHDSVVFWTEPG